ncbi:MAG: Crp/Fnr family transcriptional regulator [Bacteroidota bacterium]
MIRSQCAMPDCDKCVAHDVSVFSELVPADLHVISSSKSCRQYSKGEMIFYADDLPSGLFCIHKGIVKLYKVGKNGKEQIIRLANEGDIIGYRSLLCGDRYTTFAVPIGDAQICHIPKSTFFSLVSTSHQLASRVMELLSTELRAAEEKIVEMAQKPVRERLAETLLLLRETYGLEADNVTLTINLTRIELANIVGTATESVSRLLSKFKDEKLIDMNGRKLKIIDPVGLADVADLDD